MSTNQGIAVQLNSAVSIVSNVQTPVASDSSKNVNFGSSKLVANKNQFNEGGGFIIKRRSKNKKSCFASPA